MAINKTHIRARNAFSFKKHLEKQGVTTREGFDFHMNFVRNTMAVNPSLNLRRYKVNPNNPNGGVNHG